jgi:photosystem II stability/assembly factor-like uncharacterized protein
MKNKFLLLISIGLLSLNLTNGQNQWVSQTSGTSAFLTSVYFVSADSGYVCSQGGNILKTVNGGNNWNQVGTGPGNSLFFLNAHKGFGTYDNYILVTQNGGINWNTSYTNPDFWGINNICFPDKKHGFAIAWSNDMNNYVLKTNNGGVLWDTVYKYSNTLSLFSSMFFKDSLNGFVGCDNGFILKTTNAGTSWVPIPIDTVNMVPFISIYFPTPDTGYAASDASIYRTINGGNTWSYLPMNFPPALYSVWFTDANHGFVGGGDGLSSMTLYQTSNGGNTWSQSLSGTQTLNSIFFVGNIPGYAVGTNGTILKYINTSGIDDNLSSETHLNLYPNPATTNLNIDGISNHATAEVYDLSGKLLLTKQLNENQIDISSLAKGLYFIKLSTTGSVVRKFVKE